MGVAQPARVNWQDPKAIIKLNEKIRDAPLIIEEEEKTAQEGVQISDYMPDSTRVNFFTSDQKKLIEANSRPMTGSRPMTSSSSFKIPIASNAPMNAVRSKNMDLTGINFFDEADLQGIQCKEDKDETNKSDEEYD